MHTCVCAYVSLVYECHHVTHSAQTSTLILAVKGLGRCKLKLLYDTIFFPHGGEESLFVTSSFFAVTSILSH